MKSFSAAARNEADLDFDDVAPQGPSFDVNDLPDRTRSPVMVAETAREAGRLSAAQVKPAELDSLLQERQRLLDKKFAGTLTKPESNRLALVRWSLDRIDDARRGHALESMDAFVSRLEGFQESVATLHRDLAAASRSGRRRRGR